MGLSTDSRIMMRESGLTFMTILILLFVLPWEAQGPALIVILLPHKQDSLKWTVCNFCMRTPFYAPEESLGAYKNFTVRSSVRLCVRIHVRAITVYCMNGFSYNLAEVFDMSRWCVTQKNHMHISKVKVTLAVSVFICMLSCPGCNFLMHWRILKKYGTNV